MKKKLLVFLIAFALSAMTLVPTLGGETNVLAKGTLVTQEQNRPTGKILSSFRQGDGERPDWVASAFAQAIARLQEQQGRELGIVDPTTELRLLSVDQDDLGMTHVRMDQVYKDVPVFGGQIISHHYASGEHWANGRIFEDARGVNVKPGITAETAIELAKAAFNRRSDFARVPMAELAILPEAVKLESDARGATLTYKVDLFISNSRETARYFFFVNARNGNIEWSYDNLQSGIGYSQYSGTVTIGTVFNGTLYEMRDNTRTGGNICGTKPGIITSDFGATGGNTCSPFTDADDVWGNGNNSNHQTAGVDAHFGATLTYNYYQSRGRNSLDGSGYQMAARTWNNTYGVDQAFWDGQTTNYGSGSAGRSWTSLDIVGHEFTHGLTQFSAGLEYFGQSGGSNESFSDIFGTVVEFSSGINGDYLIGEDVVNGGLRIMSNPRLDGHSIDHISQYYPGIDVHYSSGLQNVAFYLLAEGGNHPTFGTPVKRIGRDNAGALYFRALTLYLFPSASFADVRVAVEHATTDLFQGGNPIYQAVQKSWFSVGIGLDVSLLSIDNAQGFVTQQYRDFLLREPDSGGLAFWSGQITQCGNDAVCEDAARVNVSRAFFYSAEFQQQARAANLVNLSPPPDFNNHEFVKLCYLVYLQRQPDQAGWDFWTSILNSNNNYGAIIRAFLVSAEYRDRFGGGPQGCDMGEMEVCLNQGGNWNSTTCMCTFPPPPPDCRPGEVPKERGKGEEGRPPVCRQAEPFKLGKAADLIARP